MCSNLGMKDSSIVSRPGLERPIERIRVPRPSHDIMDGQETGIKMPSLGQCVMKSLCTNPSLWASLELAIKFVVTFGTSRARLYSGQLPNAGLTVIRNSHRKVYPPIHNQMIIAYPLTPKPGAGSLIGGTQIPRRRPRTKPSSNGIPGPRGVRVTKVLAL